MDSGAVSCGIASAVMLLTGTVHPPGGASAVLAAIDPTVTAMGWYFAAVVLLGTTLMLLVGLITNNIQRQFPVYWWTPSDISRTKREDEEALPVERACAEKNSTNVPIYERHGQMIQIMGTGVIIPEFLSLNEDEARMLEKLKWMLRKRVNADEEDLGLEKMEPHCARSSTDVTIFPNRSDGVGDTRSPSDGSNSQLIGKLS